MTHVTVPKVREVATISFGDDLDEVRPRARAALSPSSPIHTHTTPTPATLAPPHPRPRVPCQVAGEPDAPAAKTVKRFEIVQDDANSVHADDRISLLQLRTQRERDVVERQASRAALREHLDRVRGIALDAAKLDPQAGLTDVERTRTWYQGPIRLAPTADQVSTAIAAQGEGGAGLRTAEARMLAGRNAALQANVKSPSPYVQVSGTLCGILQGGLGHAVEIGVHNAKLLRMWNNMRTGALRPRRGSGAGGLMVCLLVCARPCTPRGAAQQNVREAEAAIAGEGAGAPYADTRNEKPDPVPAYIGDQPQWVACVFVGVCWCVCVCVCLSVSCMCVSVRGWAASSNRARRRCCRAAVWTAPPRAAWPARWERRTRRWSR